MSLGHQVCKALTADAPNLSQGNGNVKDYAQRVNRKDNIMTLGLHAKTCMGCHTSITRVPAAIT